MRRGLTCRKYWTETRPTSAGRCTNQGTTCQTMRRTVVLDVMNSFAYCVNSTRRRVLLRWLISDLFCQGPDGCPLKAARSFFSLPQVTRSSLKDKTGPSSLLLPPKHCEVAGSFWPILTLCNSRTLLHGFLWKDHWIFPILSLQLGPVKEYVKMLCENAGLKILIFAYHHLMMNSIMEQLMEDNVKYIRIDGRTVPQDRPVRRQFQAIAHGIHALL